ncbi:hypothetical protein ES705_23913 [subsurface metagenome]
MVRLKNPLLSFDAHGTVGDSVTFQSSTRRKFARQKPRLPYSLTLPQQYQRWLYEDYAHLWLAQSAATRQEYREAGSRFHLTGYQYYMKYMLTNLPDIALMLRLDVISGGFTLDTSRNAHVGTVLGASLTPGAIAQGILLDGINDQVTIPYSPSLQPAEVSLEGFFKANPDVSILRDIFTNTTDGSGDHQNCHARIDMTTGKLFCRSGNGTANTQVVSIQAVNDNILHHFCFTNDLVTCRVYLDGIENNTTPWTGGTLYTDANLTRIGTMYGWFWGMIDNLILYNRVLDPIEVLRHSKRRYPV